jgi:hypothetical protein
MEKIYIIVQESNVDGEIYIGVTPCKTKKTAKELLKEEKERILNKSGHFGRKNNTEEDFEAFEVEETETKFYINDPCDDYYEDVYIVERVLRY